MLSSFSYCNYMSLLRLKCLPNAFHLRVCLDRVVHFTCVLVQASTLAHQLLSKFHHIEAIYLPLNLLRLLYRFPDVCTFYMVFIRQRCPLHVSLKASLNSSMQPAIKTLSLRCRISSLTLISCRLFYCIFLMHYARVVGYECVCVCFLRFILMLACLLYQKHKKIKRKKDLSYTESPALPLFGWIAANSHTGRCGAQIVLGLCEAGRLFSRHGEAGLRGSAASDLLSRRYWFHR